MKRRTMTLLLALCLVFTLLPFAASAEDTTVAVETEHFKVTVTMDPDDAVYNLSMAALGDYFNIPIEIGITAVKKTTDLTVDEVEAALKREEGSKSLDNEYYNLLICFGNHYVAEFSLIVVKDNGQLVMYEYPDESATPYETYSDSGEVVTEGEGVGPFKLYAAESQKDFPTSIDTGNVEGSISSAWGKNPEKSEESVSVPKVPDENRIEVNYGEPIPTKDSAGITATIPISVKNTGYSSGSKCLAFYATYKDNNEDKNSTLGPLTLHFDYINNELVLSRDGKTWVKEYETDEGITITFANTGEYETKIYAVLLDDETDYYIYFLADPESYIEDITPSNVKVSVWEVKYATGTDDSVTGMPEDTVVAGGGSVALGNPSRENYVFKGWDSNDDGEVDYQPGAAIENISSDLTLTAVWALKEYTVSFDSAGGSAVDEQTVEHGKTVDKPADPTRAGFAFEGWYVGDREYDFTQPVTSNITLTAKWREIFTVTLVYGRGDIETVPVKDGETFTLRAPAKPGYIFMGWKYGDATYQAGEKFTVTGDMTFTAVWANMPDITPGTPDTPDEPDALPFTDVHEGQWFYEAVKYVYGAGIMNGMDRYTFQPNGTLTRAMVWTMLARLDGVDTEGGSTWYAKAKAWAMDKGVSDGTDPMGNITREQLVTMLYRFAEMNGADMTQGGMGIREYSDYAEISDWALTAMAWAVNNGIIEGDAGALKPTSTCTRAEAAAMFMRSCNNIL